METLVVVEHHRNHHHQYYDRNRGNGSPKFPPLFESVPQDNFQGINCRAYESGAGLLPTPSDSSMVTPVSKRVPSSASPNIPSPSMRACASSSSETKTSLKRRTRNIMVPIPIKTDFQNKGDFYFSSERWAGPAYSISPPPSSLPMPNFSMQPKRTNSFDLTKEVSKLDLFPSARSAPTSPRRERKPRPNDDDLFESADSATRTLRRILNLDITNE